MGKYTPLMNYLENCDKEKITLSYDEIESIIGDKLPATARKMREWWSNNDNSHTQSAAWSDVGYRTCDIVLNEFITFEKV